MSENTREIYESLYPNIFVGHYGIFSEEFNKPFDYFAGYDYLVNMIEEKNKENEQLKEENTMLKAYIEQLKQYIIIADGEWFKYSNLEELMKEDDENESKSNRVA